MSVTQIKPPAPGESCAMTTYDKLKQAALLFDKIHMDYDNISILSELGNPPAEILFCLPDCDSLSPEIKKKVIKYANTIDGKGHPDSLHTVWRSRIDNYAKKGFEVIPLYSSEDQFEADYGTGIHIGYQGTLNNIAIVADGHLSWDQVIEFRTDKNAARKYRAMRCWLREALTGKSISEATDIIGSKLDDYEWAIKKYGMKTTTSTMSQVLDSKTIALLSGSSATGFLLGGPIVGALAGGITLGTKALIWGAEKRLELEDIKRGSNSEVAIIYEMNDKFSN